MSFAMWMKPKLNPDDKTAEDNEWYLKATTEALNSWMDELEIALMMPTLPINGSAITPVGVTVPVTVPAGAYFQPQGLRFTLQEVKDAMWTKDVNTSFINLFDLVADKITSNFNKVIGLPTLIGGCAKPQFITSHFAAYAIQLITWAEAQGAAMNADPNSEGITPESFLEQESAQLLAAVKSIPPMVATVVGDPIPATPVMCPAGVFTGTVGANFAAAT